MSNRQKSSDKRSTQAGYKSFVSLFAPLGTAVGISLIVIVAAVIYLPSINGGFILDDGRLVTENDLVRASDGMHRFWCTTEATDYWPATNTTFWIEWRLWGISPTGYHVSNLILHIIESLLIWVILRKMSIPGAFLAALIFTVHPVNVESVAWIAQRKNMMAMLFFLLSILWFLKADMPTAIAGMAPARSHGGPWEPESFSSFTLHPSSFLYWYWLSLAAFLLAMLSKGSAAVLPVVVLGIVWWLRPLTRRDAVRSLPFFAVAAALAGVNVWFQSHGSEIVIRNVGFAERLFGAGGVVWFYLYKAILPVDLAFVYQQWQIKAGNLWWWLPLAAVIVVTALLWRYRKGWSRPFLFAWGFFCVSLVPVMGFTDVGFMEYSLVADHYQHIAIIGVIALAAAGWGIWHQHGKETAYWTTTVVAVTAAGMLAFMTWRQSSIYSGAMTLYQSTVEKNPDCWMAHNNLGLTLFNSGRLQEPIEHYKRALQLKPDYPDACCNMGIALAKLGRLQEAMENYEQALRINPKYFKAHNNMGAALSQAGRPKEAIEHYEQALRIKSDYSPAHFNLGNVLLDMGRYQEAIAHYERVLRLNPDNYEAYNRLGSALAKTGRTAEAIANYEQALRLKPDYSDAHNNLAVTLVQTGRPEEAIKHYEQALRLKPNYPEAQNNLGITLSQMGRWREAIQHFLQALRLNPNYPEAHYNMGNVLVQTDRPGEAIEHYRQALRLRPDFSNAYYNLALAYARVHQSTEAIAAAQTALKLAQSQGRTAQAKQIEDWLNSYRASLPEFPSAPPPYKSDSPPP